MKKKKNKRKKKRTLPHKPDVVDGGLKTTESAIENMIDEGLGGGNTDPHVNGSLDPPAPKDDDEEE